ncbi:MAG: M48 family metallopeptidase [bacterium]
MATLYTHKSSNIWKTWLLMAVFLVLLVVVGYFASLYFGNVNILYIALIFSLFMNVLSYWYSDKIALSMSGARAIDMKNAEEREIHNLLENVSITAGLPTPRLFIIVDDAPNAFATGRNKEHGAVAVTTGLLKILDKSELEGVLAHELSHIGNRDTLLSTVVVILVGLVVIISDMVTRSMFFGGRRDRDSDSQAGNILMIVGIVFIILSPIIASIIQLAISRKREFLADSTGALITRYPEGLANALRKISGYGAPMIHANNAMAHLYISNPFGAKATNGIAKMFMTHPPVEDRIKALLGEKAAQNMMGDKDSQNIAGENGAGKKVV